MVTFLCGKVFRSFEHLKTSVELGFICDVLLSVNVFHFVIIVLIYS